MQARYYDPVIGRFYSNDPVGFSNVHNFNRYAYANNNPYKYVDPDGRAVETAWDAFSMGVGATSFVNNVSDGNYSAAAVDAVGVILDAAAAVIPFVPGGAGVGIAASREATESVVKLQKQYASESQLTQLAEGGGTVISQPAKQAERVAAQTGVDANKVQKVSSDAYTTKDGLQVQTHSFRDADTNQLIEPKTMIEEAK